MDKYIGFGIDSKKTVTCVIQKGKPLTNRRRPLKTFTIFMIFVKFWDYRAYDADIFAELADDGFLGCRAVLGANSRKMGHFGVLPVRPGALLALTGWWD